MHERSRVGVVYQAPNYSPFIIISIKEDVVTITSLKDDIKEIHSLSDFPPSALLVRELTNLEKIIYGIDLT